MIRKKENWIHTFTGTKKVNGVHTYTGTKKVNGVHTYTGTKKNQDSRSWLSKATYLI